MLWVSRCNQEEHKGYVELADRNWFLFAVLTLKIDKNVQTSHDLSFSLELYLSV